nr:auxin-responsive protein SAUR32-like [Ipomoea batatas]
MDGAGENQELHHHSPPGTPKGCVAVMVGLEEEERRRFVIPVAYLKHPSFQPLLKDSAEEFGFVHDGPVNIPCCVEKFRRVQRSIEGETGGVGVLHHRAGGNHFCWSAVSRCSIAEMGGGDKEIRHQEAAAPQQIPKGFVAVMVGSGGGDEEQQRRFVIPVTYLNHPLFLRLLKEAEEENGFHHDGPLSIPCPVDEFRRVQGLIDKETARHRHHLGGNHSWCFKLRA